LLPGGGARFGQLVQARVGDTHGDVYGDLTNVPPRQLRIELRTEADQPESRYWHWHIV